MTDAQIRVVLQPRTSRDELFECIPNMREGAALFERSNRGSLDYPGT